MARKYLPLEHLQRPLTPMAAVREKSRRHTTVGAMLVGQRPDRRQIALDIASADPEAGSEVRVWSYPLVQSQARRNFTPDSASRLAYLRQRVRRAQRRRKKQV